MSELDDLRRSNEELRQRLAETEEVVRALTSGEIDAVVQDGAATPVLLRAAQEKLQEREQFLRSSTEPWMPFSSPTRAGST
jgi:ABC-type amino acid transport substrate-binding protein